MNGHRVQAALAFVFVLAAACSSGNSEPLDVAAMLERGSVTTASGIDPLKAAPGAESGNTATARAGEAKAGGPGGVTPGSRHTDLTAGEGGTGATTVPGEQATVKIGIRYITGIDQLINLLGARGLSVPDTRAMAEAIVEDLNERGGLAGRKIEAVYHAYDASDPTGTATQEQQACAFFAADEHVSIVVSGFFSSDVLQTCLGQRGVVLIDENYGFFDMSVVPDTYFVPGFPDPVRSAGTLVDSLVARGFFGREPKIGVTMKDTRDRHRVAAGLEAALQRHGLKVSDEIRYTADHPEALSAGILRFRSTGISHVFILDIGGLESGTIMQQAESQGYRPRYGIDTKNVPFYLATNAPREQLEGAAGIGWAPSSDVGRGQGSEPRAEEQRCIDIMRGAGIELLDAGNDKLAYAYCDVLFLLETATARTGDVTAAAIRRGVESLADGYRPVGSFAARFGPSRHDGAAAARGIEFDGRCGCFQYTTDFIGIR